jgi:hypothetical protein
MVNWLEVLDMETYKDAVVTLNGVAYRQAAPDEYIIINGVVYLAIKGVVINGSVVVQQYEKVLRTY